MARNADGAFGNRVEPFGNAVGLVGKIIFLFGNTIFPLRNIIFPFGNAVFPLSKIVLPFGNIVFPVRKIILLFRKAVFPFRKGVGAIGNGVGRRRKTALDGQKLAQTAAKPVAGRQWAGSSRIRRRLGTVPFPATARCPRLVPPPKLAPWRRRPRRDGDAPVVENPSAFQRRRGAAATFLPVFSTQPLRLNTDCRPLKTARQNPEPA